MRWITLLFFMLFGRPASKEPPVRVGGPEIKSAPDSYWDNRYGY